MKPWRENVGADNTLCHMVPGNIFHIHFAAFPKQSIYMHLTKKEATTRDMASTSLIHKSHPGLFLKALCIILRLTCANEQSKVLPPHICLVFHSTDAALCISGSATQSFDNWSTLLVFSMFPFKCVSLFFLAPLEGLICKMCNNNLFFCSLLLVVSAMLRSPSFHLV